MQLSGVGLDCCVIPVRHGENLSLIQTTDFFYPLINDPYMMVWSCTLNEFFFSHPLPVLQGRITCCNVLSDLYAMGVVDADNMLMLLGVSTDMTDQERDIVIPIMLRGFRVCLFAYSTRCPIVFLVSCPSAGFLGLRGRGWH